MHYPWALHLLTMRNRSEFRLTILFLILIAFAQPLLAERLPFKTYTTEDGLAHDSINKIVRDSRGFLWFCTAEGLSRFDGLRFTNFTQDHGLPHRNIYDFLETRDGTYMIATSYGLTIFDPLGRAYRWNVLEGRLEKNSGERPMFRTYFPESEKRQTKIIFSLAQDSNGTIWAGTAHGLFTVERSGDDWVLSNVDVENAIKTGYHALFSDSRGNLIVASDVGMYKRSSGGSFVKFDSYGAHSIMEDREGNLWVGAGGDLIGLRVFAYHEETPRLVRTYKKPDGLPEDSFQIALKQTSDGRIYVGCSSGLVEFDRNAGSNDPKFRPVESDKITTIVEDAGNNIWFGTEAKGAWKLPQRGFTNFGEKDGLSLTEDFRSIYMSRDDEMIIPTRPSKILYFENGGFRSIVPFGFKGRSWGWHFLDLKSKDGEWWIPAADGLRRYPKVAKFSDLANTPPIKVYTTEDGFIGNEIFNIFEDSSGDIWITISGSIARIERATKHLTNYSQVDGLPEGNGAISFAEDKNGALWFGFYFGGLARYRDGKFDVFGPKDGLPESQASDLMIDARGRLWIGTSGFGTFVVDDVSAEKPVFTNLSTQNGLSSNQIICMTQDRFGRNYVGTGRGINRIDASGSVRVFTQADGLPSNFITRCSAANDGTLWFVSGNTLVRFSPEMEQEPAPISVFIDKFLVNGVAQKISALGETDINLPDLSSDQRQIQVNFFAMTFSSGENIRYQYALDGKEWSNPTDQQTVNLDLSSGEHSFAVRAIRTDGVASERPATVKFRILSPIWLRWWFIALVVLIFGGVIFGLYYYRMSNLRAINAALTEANRADEDLRRSREERIAELDRVRSRIATDLHDDIGASLTQIAILSEVAQTKAKSGTSVEQPLTKITDVSNELVGTMSDIVWSINPSKDHLSDLSQRMRRFAADVLAARSIRFHYGGGDDDAGPTVINSNIRREVFLIFKESINNIVKHSNARNVWVELKVVAGDLRLSVKDDGDGFDPANAHLGDRGNGLSSMRRRSREMRGSFEIDSRPGSGTTVLVRFSVDNTL